MKYLTANSRVSRDARILLQDVLELNDYQVKVANQVSILLSSLFLYVFFSFNTSSRHSVIWELFDLAWSIHSNNMLLVPPLESKVFPCLVNPSCFGHLHLVSPSFIKPNSVSRVHSSLMSD